MKIIRYRFYSARAAAKDGRKMSLTEKIIDLRSSLTHAETQFDENRNNISWSSTLAEGANGCRFRDIGYSHEKYWETLSFIVSDAEEQRLWEFCCTLADMPFNWQDSADLFFDGKIYQGSEHIKYDAKGLLSFALEKAPVWYGTVLRWAVWGWTVFIKPDFVAVWCSEACAKGFNAMHYPSGQLGSFSKTEIDPGEMYDRMLKFNGVKVGSIIV